MSHYGPEAARQQPFSRIQEQAMLIARREVRILTAAALPRASG
jgi:hypothetical protein